MNESNGVREIFGFPVGALISVGEYFDYSGVVLNALVNKRYYEAVAVCAVLVDVIVGDILDNLPASLDIARLRRMPVGAVLKELAKSYTTDQEAQLLRQLEELNRLRIRVVHPGSDSPRDRIHPDKCPPEFAQAFFDQLERTVDALGGYTNRQFGEDFQQFVHRRRGPTASEAEPHDEDTE
jgi:hypothetical protein